jgi:hypothetical protein
MIEIKGFDDLSKKLEDLAEKAESILARLVVILSFMRYASPPSGFPSLGTDTWSIGRSWTLLAEN